MARNRAIEEAHEPVPGPAWPANISPLALARPASPTRRSERQHSPTKLSYSEYFALSEDDDDDDDGVPAGPGPVRRAASDSSDDSASEWAGSSSGSDDDADGDEESEWAGSSSGSDDDAEGDDESEEETSPNGKRKNAPSSISGDDEREPFTSHPSRSSALPAKRSRSSAPVPTPDPSPSRPSQALPVARPSASAIPTRPSESCSGVALNVGVQGREGPARPPGPALPSGHPSSVLTLGLADAVSPHDDAVMTLAVDSDETDEEDWEAVHVASPASSLKYTPSGRPGSILFRRADVPSVKIVVQSPDDDGDIVPTSDPEELRAMSFQRALGSRAHSSTEDQDKGRSSSRASPFGQTSASHLPVPRKPMLPSVPLPSLPSCAVAPTLAQSHARASASLPSPPPSHLPLPPSAKIFTPEELRLHAGLLTQLEVRQRLSAADWDYKAAFGEASLQELNKASQGEALPVKEGVFPPLPITFNNVGDEFELWIKTISPVLPQKRSEPRTYKRVKRSINTKKPLDKDNPIHQEYLVGTFYFSQFTPLFDITGRNRKFRADFSWLIELGCKDQTFFDAFFSDPSPLAPRSAVSLRAAARAHALRAPSIVRTYSTISAATVDHNILVTHEAFEGFRRAVMPSLVKAVGQALRNNSPEQLLSFSTSIQWSSDRGQELGEMLVKAAANIPGLNRLSTDYGRSDFSSSSLHLGLRRIEAFDALIKLAIEMHDADAAGAGAAYENEEDIDDTGRPTRDLIAAIVRRTNRSAGVDANVVEVAGRFVTEYSRLEAKIHAPPSLEPMILTSSGVVADMRAPNLAQRRTFEEVNNEMMALTDGLRQRLQFVRGKFTSSLIDKSHRTRVRPHEPTTAPRTSAEADEQDDDDDDFDGGFQRQGQSTTILWAPVKQRAIIADFWYLIPDRTLPRRRQKTCADEAPVAASVSSVKDASPPPPPIDLDCFVEKLDAQEIGMFQSKVFDPLGDLKIIAKGLAPDADVSDDRIHEVIKAIVGLDDWSTSVNSRLQEPDLPFLIDARRLQRTILSRAVDDGVISMRSAEALIEIFDIGLAASALSSLPSLWLTCIDAIVARVATETLGGPPSPAAAQITANLLISLRTSMVLLAVRSDSQWRQARIDPELTKVQTRFFNFLAHHQQGVCGSCSKKMVVTEETMPSLVKLTGKFANLQLSTCARFARVGYKRALKLEDEDLALPISLIKAKSLVPCPWYFSKHSCSDASLACALRVTLLAHWDCKVRRDRIEWSVAGCETALGDFDAEAQDPD